MFKFIKKIMNVKQTEGFEMLMILNLQKRKKYYVKMDSR